MLHKFDNCLHVKIVIMRQLCKSIVQVHLNFVSLYPACLCAGEKMNDNRQFVWESTGRNVIEYLSLKLLFLQTRRCFHNSIR